MKIFVYGTLKRCFHNHHILERHGAKLIGERILPGFWIKNYSDSFPVAFPKLESNLAGEVYEVNEKCLDHLDYLEREGHMYKRTEIVGEDMSIYLGVPQFWATRERLFPITPDEHNVYKWG